MKCPFCNREMENGYLTSDARAIAWRKERYQPALIRKGGGIQLARNPMGGAAAIANAFCCQECKKIVIDYSEKEGNE
ncbi:PF20097 family protein [Diplocloster modestus]|uniref:DUF6487 domain-containing protein n=1 Tax=Diplocloster modestus TaxID=2850322 RepID=A0ABS6K2X3_9FIRM|nr:PF20097 family protein [Diplocloster modestus]MBU9724861.1 hypothetical protein [Diplocloster modestus]